MDLSTTQATLINGFMDRLEKHCTERSGESRLAMAIIRKAIQDVIFQEDEFVHALKEAGQLSRDQILKQKNRMLRIKRSSGEFLLGANGMLSLWTENAGLNEKWVKEKIWKLLVVLRKVQKSRKSVMKRRRA